MVRSAQSMTLLSHSLKLSLLFSQEPVEGSDGQSIDEEALSLIESTAKSKEICARLLEKMFNLEEIETTGHDEMSREAKQETISDTKQDVVSATDPIEEPLAGEINMPEDLNMEEAA